jgi:acyl phosphate:glycerol-3-phosphate acyltransferase
VLYAPFIVAGYLCGSITFGYWLVRWLKGVDIRTVGSHNLGATNVWRTYGWRWGLPVMILDIVKALGPTLAATLVIGHLCGVLTGAAAMIGHARPVFLKFARGGKMVATAGGAFLGVAPLLGLAGVGVWLVLFLVTRFASVSSILAAASLAPLAYGLGYPWPVIVFGGAAGLGVLVLHRANVRRLLAGEESRFELRRRGKPSPGAEVPASR